MQVATVKMDEYAASQNLRKAREEIAAYRRSLRERKSGEIEAARIQMDREDEEMSSIYRAIARGHQVINLMESFRITGCNEAGLPKLAIARADALKVWCRISSRDCEMNTVGPWASSKNKTQAFTIPLQFLPGVKSQRETFEAMVPLIPVRFRPKHHLSNYHILFEAEWRKVVPRDPMLLKRIGQVHYAVLAHWDLTEVERAALFGRLLNS